MTTTIIGISLENRLEEAVQFQKIITNFGCEIRTRIGLHPSNPEICSSRGIILLEVYGEAEYLINELSEIWKIQTMRFE